MSFLCPEDRVLVLKSFHEHLVKPLNTICCPFHCSWFYRLKGFWWFVGLHFMRFVVQCWEIFFHIIGEQRNLRNNKKKTGDGPWNVLSIYLLSSLIFLKNIFSNYWKTLYFHNLWFSLKKKNMYIVHVGLFLWFEEFCSTCQLDFESQIN